MRQDVTRTRQALSGTDASDQTGANGLDRLRGARVGDIRIRRPRGDRRGGMLRALRALPSAIRRVNPFG